MKIQAGSVTMNFSVHNKNKIVVGKETITVPAGTFDCVIVTSDTDTKMMIAKHTKSKNWYAKGIGLVKQEDYNKKGKLIGKQVLTQFKK